MVMTWRRARRMPPQAPARRLCLSLEERAISLRPESRQRAGSSDEVMPARCTTSDEVMPARCTTSDEVMPARCTTSDEVMPARCTTSDEVMPARCTTSDEVMPAQCTTRRKITFRMSWRNVVCAARAGHHIPCSISASPRVVPHPHCTEGAFGG
jgi:hypothetical protein